MSGSGESMSEQLKSLLAVLNHVLLQKITHETGYFILGNDSKMKFQSYRAWQSFQQKYGEFHAN